MIDIRDLLKTAAAGIVAQHGPDARNLFAEALAEIKRLDAIADDVRELLGAIPNTDKGNYLNGLTTWSESKARLEAGRRLGEAVGVFKKEGK